jgi:hypothetical protein
VRSRVSLTEEASIDCQALAMARLEAADPAMNAAR